MEAILLYASTSGHTEYVMEILSVLLHEKIPQISVRLLMAERAQPEDLLRGDVLLLASGTWNTGSIEGQLNPHMHELLKKRAASVDLAGKQVALVALGDDRYYYTCRAIEHLQQFVREHNGSLLLDPLLIVNEPYGQEEKVRKWGEKLMTAIHT